MLSCVDLHKSFDSVVALNGVALSFARGEVCAVIGPNGAGKTTLLNVLTGFIRADRGRCLLGTWDITALAPHRIALKGVSRTFQDLRLVKQLSVLDNVLLAFKPQMGESLWRALSRVGLSDQAAALRVRAAEVLSELRLSEHKHQPAGDLSYGQQKLLTIATCVATGANVLLLDEPFSGVDPGTRELVVKLIDTFRQKSKTVVFVEHDIDAVRRVADRVIAMSQGTVIADGAPEEILSRSEILESYL